MKTIADKQILMAADFAGIGLKNEIKKHLELNGWTVTDIGLQENDPNPEMFHRIGFKVGSMISEGEFEKAIIFCGTGMGIHIAAGKCPGVQAACVESVHAALRAVTGNDCNVLSMGGMWIGYELGKEMVDAFLNHKIGDGYEDIENWVEFHQVAYNEIRDFDYETYKANGFKIDHEPDPVLGQFPRP